MSATAGGSGRRPTPCVPSVAECWTAPGRSKAANTPRSRRSPTRSRSVRSPRRSSSAAATRDVERARAFVAGEIEPHDPFLLGDMAVAVDRIRAAIAGGKRICVHGDYDVDGICATALAVLTLRKLGADVEWHLPSRFEEGYGVSDVTISRLADEGCSLLITVDCGITAVEEVAAAKKRGLEVIVTDHHRPRPNASRTARSSRRARPTIRSRSCAAPASSASSPRRSASTCLPTSTSSRSRRSPTSCRCSTRTARWRSPACARWRGRSDPGCRP